MTVLPDQLFILNTDTCNFLMQDELQRLATKVQSIPRSQQLMPWFWPLSMKVQVDAMLRIVEGI